MRYIYIADYLQTTSSHVSIDHTLELGFFNFGIYNQ